MKTVAINLFAGEKRIDDLYHNADMFESFKQYAQTLCVKYDLINSEPDLAMLTRFVEGLRNSGYNVPAAWFSKNPEIHIVDWSVRVVSDGKKFTVLEDYLKHFGILKPA